MPIVQIELQFNDKGAVTGVRNMNAISDAADKAKKATSELGKEGSNSLNTLGKGAEQSASRVKGLVTQILALAGAYKALQAASSFISRTFEFSSNIESSQIAIASVIGATNKITDGQGKQLEGADKFNAAQEISAGLMEKIQVLALQTTATFDDMVQGVSGIIAPATKAGIAVEKIPQFAVLATQALTAMKIPVQQMRTEIEALLSGNINKAQDLLATNLGITGAMVRNWQQQGTLVEELEKRLRVFAEAGDATAQTWSGLKSNMQDALDYLSSKTGKGLFEGTKQSYRELLALLVNTDEGKLGLNEDVTNLASALKELEDEIGQRLVGVTREFIDYIKELNQPGRLAELKRDFKEFADTIEGLWTNIKAVGGAISSIVSTSVDGWQQMPQVVQELGIVGAVAFGAKGRAALLGLGAAYAGLKKIFDLAASGDGGADAYKLYWQRKNGEVPQEELPIPLARSGTSMDFVGPIQPRATSTTENSIGGFASNKKNTGADKIASAREQLQKLREEIAQLNGESTKAENSLDQKERQIAKLGKAAGLSASGIKGLQNQYAQAWDTKTLKDLNKELLQAENNTTALRTLENQDKMTAFSSRLNQIKSLSQEEKDLMLGRYQTALAKQVNVKDAQTNLAFIKEFAELSGNNNLATEYQNQLLAAQADIYRSQLTPELRAMVGQWERLQQLKNARDPFSGFVRGLRSYSNEASDFAKSFESLTTTAFGNVESAFADILTSGQLSFTNFANSIINDLARIAIRASITGPIASGLSSLLSGGGGLGSLFETKTSSVTVVSSETFHTGGMVGAGSRDIRTIPLSSFDYAPRFHGGGGYFSNDEYPAVLLSGERVLNRQETAAYNARNWVGNEMVSRENSGWQSEPRVTINNYSGAEVSTQTKTDNYGSKSLEVTIGDINARQTMKSGTSMNRAVRAATGTQTQAIRR